MNIKIDTNFRFSVASMQYLPSGELSITLVSDTPVAADLQSDANYYKDFQSVKTITLRNKTPRQLFMVNS